MQESEADVPETAVKVEPRCWRCGKMIARKLGPGSVIDCPRCHAKNQA